RGNRRHGFYLQSWVGLQRYDKVLFSSILSAGSSFEELLVRFFLEPKNHVRAANDYWAANQIGLLGHQLDGFRAGMRMLLHIARPVELVAWIQKFFVVALANQLFEFGRAQTFLIEVARFKFCAQ